MFLIDNKKKVNIFLHSLSLYKNEDHYPNSILDII